MIRRIACVASLALLPCWLTSAITQAQDVPGIEICTVEKTMERRTSCLQSNVDFLQKIVDDLQAAQKKAADDAGKKADAAPAKDAAPAGKEGGK